MITKIRIGIDDSERIDMTTEGENNSETQNVVDIKQVFLKSFF